MSVSQWKSHLERKKWHVTQRKVVGYPKMNLEKIEKKISGGVSIAFLTIEKVLPT